MEGTINVAAFSFEAAGKRDECPNQDSGDASAHTVGQGLYYDYYRYLQIMVIDLFKDVLEGRNSSAGLCERSLIFVPLQIHGNKWG